MSVRDSIDPSKHAPVPSRLNAALNSGAAQFNHHAAIRSFGSPERYRALLAKIAATVMTAWLFLPIGCGSPSFLILGGDDEPDGYTTEDTDAGRQDTGDPTVIDGGNSDDGEPGDIRTDSSSTTETTAKDSPSEASDSGTLEAPLVDACPFDASDHHNGYDGPYTYCAPKGGSDASTYSLGMASAARASTVPPGSSPIDSAGSCPDGPYVRRAGSLRCITWVYAGAAFGRLAYGSTLTCYCPDVTSPRWD